MDQDCIAVRTKKCSVIPGMTDMRNDVDGEGSDFFFEAETIQFFHRWYK